MDAPAGGPFHVTWTNVGLAYFFILFSAVVSAIFNLGVGSSLILAALRCVIQLAFVGMVLQHVFEANSPYQVMGIALLLNLLGTLEAVMNNSKKRFDYMFFCVLFSMLGSIIPVSIIGSLFALVVDPFWKPEQFIPLVGLLCGYTVSSIVVAVGYISKEIYDGRDKVEMYLAYGASRFEACTSIAREALCFALAGTINKMSIMGIIFIPGTMTGAILGGSSASQAAKLQMVTMFLVSASNALATINITIMTLVILVDSEHRIRPDRVDSREHRMWMAKTGLISKIMSATKVVGQFTVFYGKNKNGHGEHQRLLGSAT